MSPSPTPERPRLDRDSEESEPESTISLDAIYRRDPPSDFELEPEPTKVVPLHELDVIHRLVIGLKASIVDLKASLETIQRQVTVLEEVVEIVVSELLYLTAVPRPLTITAERRG
jgi:hypothetical protein